MSRKVVSESEAWRRKAQLVALVLADWWTRPDARQMELWASAAYRERVVLLWHEAFGVSGEACESLICAFSLEQQQLAAEYERLFVGPAAIPCPPYEAVWRTDRPKQEQGTVVGKSTAAVQRLYGELGLRLRSDQVELADHIAIELEALGYAWSANAVERADCLIGRLHDWLPPFCAAVVANSQLKFYRDLAEITWDFLSSSKTCACVASSGDSTEPGCSFR